jgi:hypothetical protein
LDDNTTKLWDLWKSRIRLSRAIIALFASAALVVVCIRSEYLMLKIARRAVKSNTQDFVVSYSRRLDVLKPLLPERGLIGYRSDRTDAGEFFATQYLLEPLVVVDLAAANNDAPEVTIINNHVSSPASNAPGANYTTSDQPDGSRAYDFSNGMRLIDRRPRQ